jgi:hypothetical protein
VLKASSVSSSVMPSISSSLPLNHSRAYFQNGFFPFRNGKMPAERSALARRYRSQALSRQTNTRLASSLCPWCGMAAIVGGVLFVAWGYLHKTSTPVFLARTDDPLVLRFAALVTPLLFSVALVGVFIRLAGRAGPLGVMGIALALCGSGLGAVFGAVNLGSVTGPLYSNLRQIGWPDQLLGWMPLLLAGLVLVGIETSWKRALGPWSALPLATAVSGWIYQFTDVVGHGGLRFVHVAFGVLFSLCWMCVGFVLAADNRRHV